MQHQHRTLDVAWRDPNLSQYLELSHGEEINAGRPQSTNVMPEFTNSLTLKHGDKKDVNSLPQTLGTG